VGSAPTPVRGVGRVEWCEGGEWGGVGAFIAREGDGSASGRWSRPTSGRGQTSARGRERDVGGLASSRSEAKAEQAGEGWLDFSQGGLASGRCYCAEKDRAREGRGWFGLGFW
jgi:hypothetical protein